MTPELIALAKAIHEALAEGKANADVVEWLSFINASYTAAMQPVASPV